MSRTGKGSRAKLQPQKEDLLTVSPQNGVHLLPEKKKRKTPKITVWPEFSETDVNSEKWEVGTKGKDKTKIAQFDDPDGNVELPPKLSKEIETWKRPSEYIIPVVVDTEKGWGDMIKENLHLLNSEFVRWMLCYVDLLWQLHNKAGIAGRMSESWKPWDHIYPKPKGQMTPTYNPCGKYCVKIFWLGLWRKVTVDDQMPFNKDNQLMLPMTQPHELWLPLLTKAVLKVVSLDSNKDMQSWHEFGDCNIAQLLTGWVVEVIPIRSGHAEPMWNLFHRGIPVWSFNDTPEIEESKQETLAASTAVGKGKSKTEQTQVKEQPSKKEEFPYILFASYDGSSSLQKQVNGETLFSNEFGLPTHLSHVVMVTQTRRQPLEEPLPPDPDSLIPKFAHQGFKSRRQREEEAKIIADKFKAMTCRLVEVISPLMNLQAIALTEKVEVPPTDMEKAEPSKQSQGKVGGQETSQEAGETEETRTTNIWMQYDEEFIPNFTTLYVVHKPGGYKQKQAVQDMKNVIQTTFGSSSGLKKDKSASNLRNASAAPFFSHSHPNAEQVGPTGTLGSLLCVDSVKAIEIILSLSTITHWPYKRKSVKSLTGSSYALGEALEEAKSDTEEAGHSQPTLLTAEEYQWDTVVAGQPLLKIKTTGTKAAALCLPPGRHLIRLNVSASVCFHLELWSLCEFIFQEEDEVLHELTKESIRYRTHAINVLSTFVVVATMFEDIKQYRESFYQQGLSHRGRDITVHHCRLLYSSLMDTIMICLPEELRTRDMIFAWQAFSQEGFRVFLQGLEKDVPKNASEVDKLRYNDLKFADWKQKDVIVPSNWIDHEATEEEHAAATKIQACFKGYWRYKLWKAVTHGSPEHKKAFETMERSFEIITQESETVALKLFSIMFRKDPQLLTKFPFKDDEWSRACFKDHTGHYKEQPPNSMFLMFRETFYVEDHAVLIVPHLYTSVSTCSLRVFNNDTGEEIPRVFQRVSPHIYLPNRHGYTFVAEGRSGDEPIAEGKCRLRLIGSEESLLIPKSKGTVNCEFYTKLLKEYYLPNKQYQFFRLAVKVTEDMVVTVQLETSKESAYIRLQILDTIDGEEQEVKSVCGKGYAIIPAFTFLKDGIHSESQSPVNYVPEDDDLFDVPTLGRDSIMTSRPPSRKQSVDLCRSSRASVRQDSSSRILEQQSKPSQDTADNENTAQKEGGDMESDGKEDRENATEGGFMVHKYILCGTVERNSWPESESAWDFVSVQKAAEKQDLENSRPGSSADRSHSAIGKKSKLDKKGMSKVKGSSQQAAKSVAQFDTSVPHWTVKIVTLEKDQANIEVKKDTEREDEIKAIKQSWEAAEPGRAVKAATARQKFLNRRMSQSRKSQIPDWPVPEKLQEEGEDEEGSVAINMSASRFQVDTSRPNSGMLQQYSRSSFSSDHSPLINKLSMEEDISPFKTRKPICQYDYSAFSTGPCAKPRQLDDAELKRREAKRKEEMEEYKLYRESVLQIREHDREERKRLKTVHLDVAEKMQVEMDELRSRFNNLREVCRKKHLEEEQSKVDAAMASSPTIAEMEEAQQKLKSPSRKGKKK